MRKNKLKVQPKKQKKNQRKTKKSYIEDYNNSKSKEEFIKIVLSKYSDITKATAERRYYDVRQKLKQDYTPIISRPINKPIKWKYDHTEKINPHPLKIIMVKDMIRLNIKIDRKYLQKYGFNDMEINWLVDEGLIDLKED